MIKLLVEQKNLTIPKPDSPWRKRLCVPTWWLESLLLHAGTKEIWFAPLTAQMKTHHNCVFAIYPDLSIKDIFLCVAVWHEVIVRYQAAEDFCGPIEVPLGRYLSGTWADMQITCRRLEEIWSSALVIESLGLVCKRGAKLPSLQMVPKGRLNIVKSVQLVISSPQDARLVLHFHSPLIQVLNRFFLTDQGIDPGQTSVSAESAELTHTSPIVSLSTTVLRAMIAERAQMKSVLHYLLLEYQKQFSSPSFETDTSISVGLGAKGIVKFHKDFAGLSALLYDHGVLSWQADHKRYPSVAQLKSQKNAALVCLYQPSSQLKETALVESSVVVQKKVVQKMAVPVEVTETPTPVFTHYEKNKKRFETLDTLSDREFIIMISEFYESLQGAQKRAFERERQSMSMQQFRSYMTPILKRKQASRMLGLI